MDALMKEPFGKGLIYLDNAATSFPRSPLIADMMRDYLDHGAGSVGRGQYASAFDLEEKVLEAREAVAGFFGASDSSEAVFTPGGTFSLNMFIKGFLKKGDHVIVSPLEHNAVMRPLSDLAERGVASYDVAPSKEGVIDVEAIEPLVRPNTRAIICAHASNVSGAVQDIAAIGRIARRNSIAFCVDACQSAGSVKLDVQESNVDFLAFTGHKGLLGLPGSGGAIMRGLDIDPLLMGGTGSLSESFRMPSFAPDRFEAGTPCVPGVMALKCGIDFLESIGIEEVHRRKRSLRDMFVEGLESGKLKSRARILGGKKHDNTGIASVILDGADSASVARELDRRFSVCVRVGLHCAPLAHKTLKSFEEGGAIRFSFSVFNTVEEVERTVCALEEIAKGL